MGLYISRMLQRILSWFTGDLLINMELCFVFLMASTSIMFIFIYIIYILINCLDFLFRELGIFQGLDWVSFFVSLILPWILPCIFILILIASSILYSLHVESKFLITDKSWWSGTFVKSIIICIIIFHISIWLNSSNGQLVVRSLPEPLALLVVILYSVLLFVLVLCIMVITSGVAFLIQRQQCNCGIATHFESARSAVDKLVESQNDEKCLFEWDDIPGKDSEKLASYLREDRDICWVESKNIHKSKDDQSIHISEDENLIKIMIDKKKEKGILEINNARICDLKVKKESDKLNIYEVTNYKDMYRIYMVSENYKSGINEIKDLLRRGIDLNRNPNLNEILDQLAFWMQYYLFYGGSEQTESVKKHLDQVPKSFDKQYHINLDQFVYEILRMNGEIDDYFEKNEIRPTRRTGFVYRLIDRLLKKSPEIAVLIITVLLIYLLKLVPCTIELLSTKLPVPFL